MELGTVFGKVTAHIEFMRRGADNLPLAQAFRFLHMDDESSKRFSDDVSQMERAGFGDVEEKENALGDLASKTLSKLLDSVRHVSMVIAPVGQKPKI